MSVLITTSLGDVVIDLYTDRCPLTCKNFLKLCKIKYYNGCLFHNVQKDFTAQTGDPTGSGTGGDSIYKFLFGDQARFFGDEIHLDIKHLKTGTVAMASAGENLNASQFYITLRDGLDYLDEKHTVFGEVAEGLETLSRINEAYVDEKGRPYKNIRIKHTYILDDPFSDPAQLVEFIPEASPTGKPKDEIDDNVRLEDDWVPMDEELGPAELDEAIRSKGAHSSAVVLEAIGDIPEAEVKPPDNVLFVCKLNPVTEDEDLHTIFSRFGTVVSADIIRDFKTGDSLCYAFIEFETNEACEQAYFKMNNALIDDRRIHVDFSQSVSKLWSQFRHKNHNAGKGKGCFKCGALGHIAKDCSGGDVTERAPQPSKYVLKDDNAQRGGDDNSDYKMLFGHENDVEHPKGKRTLHEDDDEDVRIKKRNSNEDRKNQNNHREFRESYGRERSDRSYNDDGNRKRRRMSDRHGDERERSGKHGDERERSVRCGDERERREKHVDEREGSVRRGDGRERSDRRGDERERSDRHGDERERSDRIGDERERSDRHGDERERSDRDLKLRRDNEPINGDKEHRRRREEHIDRRR